MEIINDIRSWLLDETIITDIVGTKVWKYECRTISDKVFGLSGSRALVIDLLPGVPNNPMSSQHNGFLEVKCYASNSITEDKKTKNDGEDRCWDMYYTINPVLNRVSRETKSLTDFLILGIFRNGEPTLEFDEIQNCSYVVALYELEYLLS